MERAEEPVESAGSPPPEHRLVVDKKLARRQPGTSLLVAGLLVPALIAGAAGYLAGPAAEETLVDRASQSLRDSGVRGVKLEADGPFVTAFVPTRVDPLKVGRVVEQVGGVSAVTTEQVFASKQEARACADLGRKLDRATNKQRIPFAGESSRLTASGRSMVVAAAKLVAACGSAKVYVGAHTDSRTSEGPALTIKRARDMIDLMGRNGVPEERMEPRGYGAQYPVDESGSQAARQRNQRGSITVVEG